MPKPLWYFLSTEAKIAFAVLFSIYWISETIISRCMRAGSQDHNEDRGSLRLLAILMPLSWLIAPALVVVPQTSFGNPTVFIAGLALMIAGQLLRWWSIATLGGLFTVNVAIRAGHRLIESGPYRFVRHPAYTAILLFHLGTALCLGNVLSLIVLTVPVTAGLLNRMRVEEDVLASGLGQTYREYMNRTKRLIPGLY